MHRAGTAQQGIGNRILSGGGQPEPPIGTRKRYLIRNHPYTALLPLGGGLDVVPRHDVDQEVELVVLGDGHGDVVPLQGAPLVVLQMYSLPGCFVNQCEIHCTVHLVNYSVQ